VPWASTTIRSEVHDKDELKIQRLNEGVPPLFGGGPSMRDRFGGGPRVGGGKARRLPANPPPRLSRRSPLPPPLELNEGADREVGPLEPSGL